MRAVSRLKRGLSGGQGKTLGKLVVYGGVCLVVLLYLISLIGNIHFFQDYTGYKARMPDVTGLLANDAVKVAGVEVGKVTDISLEHGTAVVSFKVKSDYDLHQGVKTAVRWRNLLGQKYLYLSQPKDGPALQPGSTIGADHALDNAEVGDFLNAVGPILEAIDPAKANAFIHALNEALSGNDQRIRELLSNTASIAETVGGLDQEVGSILRHLRRVTGALADRNQALNDTITNLRTLSGQLAEKNRTLLTLVDHFSDFTEQLDRLITTNRAELDTTISNLRGVVDVLARHHDDLEKGLATLPGGFSGYHLVSRSGQWFNARLAYICIAGGNCLRNDVLGQLLGLGNGPAAAVPSLTTLLDFAASGSPPA